MNEMWVIVSLVLETADDRDQLRDNLSSRFGGGIAMQAIAIHSWRRGRARQVDVVMRGPSALSLLRRDRRDRRRSIEIRPRSVQ
jgi:hypothetical protein